MRPNSWTVFSTAASRLFKSLTSAEIARHLAPFLSFSISFAIAYNQPRPKGEGNTSGCLRPRIAALAPRATRAFTWTEQIVPPPPVQKTTTVSMKNERGMPLSLKMFGWKTLEVYGIVEVTNRADGGDRLFYQVLSEVRRRGNWSRKNCLI